MLTGINNIVILVYRVCLIKITQKPSSVVMHKWIHVKIYTLGFVLLSAHTVLKKYILRSNKLNTLLF